ncbi:MAG TPA: class I SAM-dependent methyltransferase family protein [archaeon]|nr:class I SAM-dependent methyltransferase family protein [archaeon]
MENQNFKKLLLQKKVPKQIVSQIPRAYDIVGDIIITNIKKDIAKKYKKQIGESYLEIHKNIKVVLNKKEEHKGVYRTQKMEFLYGEKRKETILKENNCLIKVDVEKVFFSPRLANERKRISELVKPNEKVGVFFAGVGPFALTIAKNKNVKEIVAIELNPLAIKYLKENIKINKLENKIIPVYGDVKKKAKKYPNYFNRIIMPLPKSSELFLDDAIFSVKNNGIIHLYAFVEKRDPYNEITKKINEKQKQKNIKIKIINKKILRSYSPAIIQIVLDLKIKK